MEESHLRFTQRTLTATTTNITTTTFPENRYDFELRVRKRLLIEYDELQKIKDKLKVALKEEEVRSKKVYRREGVVAEELGNLTRLHKVII